MSDPITVSGGLILKITVMSIISGITGALNRYLIGKDKGVVDTVIIAIVHFFFGLLMGIIAKTFTGNEYVILGCSGMGGFLGVKTIGVLQSWLQTIIKTK